MERSGQLGYAMEPPCCVQASRPLKDRAQHDSVVKDAALMKLKKQAPPGCLLCVIDEWDEEDWD